ncbi:MAG: hypothetical protein A2W27_01280 [Deltaproteobacteria bacterium RBG_16_44_11]|nr:MAG: hypothetical protein A2W27_01280 [Deltaproteobacteria bacterium RBG_16_44_11]
MKNKYSYNFFIIGLGMVGTAIGHLLREAGHQITTVSDKSLPALKKAKPYTGGKTFRNLYEALNNADCILITTPDDAISSACREISRSPAIKGKFVFHMSGAGGLDLLDAARNAGAYVASIHPLQSFSSVDNAISNIPKSYFGITADEKAKRPAKNIVRDLGGIPIFISDKQKPLYHAAACLASNYFVCLLNAVESIYQAIGIDEKKAKKAYLPLVYGSLKNIERSGSTKSLTGPIARGDFGTIKKHIAAINKVMPQCSLLYSSLGAVAVQVAKQKGSLNARQAKIINELLKGAIKHEHSK